jgi:hypothetical protein
MFKFPQVPHDIKIHVLQETFISQRKPYYVYRNTNRILDAQIELKYFPPLLDRQAHNGLF